MKNLINVLCFTLALASTSANAAMCRGEAAACNKMDSHHCTTQGGCFISLDGKVCEGVASPCFMFFNQDSCAQQNGCKWM